MMRTLAFVLLVVACVSHAGDDSWLDGEGHAFYRILSSEPTRISWFDSMPNPDDPGEVWSSLIWTHASNPPPESIVSIAFDLQGAWSTQNFWQLNLEEIWFPTNFIPTNAIQAFILQALEHVTHPDSQRGALVSDIPTEYVRGQVIIKAEAGVGDPEMIALVHSYGHSIIKRFLGEPPTFLVAVSLNEEVTWAATYATNSIVRFGDLNGISRLGGSTTVLSNQTMEGTK
jgi:hypothetical protein